ncbi:MAG: DUF4131 domain-containing protein, partial [Armatimonadetes bacterium]|nr:DUF4131 domain-containing protein [Armatimonadota bacterium]
MADRDDGGRVGRPLLWLCVAFAAGTGWGIGHPWHGREWLSVAIVCLVACAAFWFGGRRALLAGLGVAFALGAARSSGEVLRWTRQPLRACLGMPVLLEGEVRSTTAELSGGGTRYDLGVQRIKPPYGPWRAMRGRVRVAHAGAVALQYGDRVRVAAALEDA